MKVLILLAGLLAFASALPLQTAEQELTSFEVDQLFADEQISLDEVKKQLKERLDEILVKIKDAIESGKALKGEFFEKAKEIKEKLQDLKGDMGEKARDLLERIREKGKEYFEKLREQLGIDKRDTEMMADEYGDIVKQLKFKFDEVTKKLKDAFEQGKTLKEGLDQLQEIRNKLKEYNIDLGGKYQEFLDKIKDKVKDYWNKLKEKLTSKRSADIDVFGMLEQLKEEIKDTFSFDRVKNIVEKYLGKGSELAKQVVQSLKERGREGREHVLSLLDKLVEEVRRVKAYFQELGIELKDRSARFGHWVKERYGEALAKGRTELQNVSAIAREFLRDTEKISRDVAEEALDFFRRYKDDLGVLYKEVERKVKDIVKKEA